MEKITYVKNEVEKLSNLEETIKELDYYLQWLKGINE